MNCGGELWFEYKFIFWIKSPYFPMWIVKHSFIFQVLTKIVIWFVVVFHFEFSTMSEQTAENTRKEGESFQRNKKLSLFQI